MKLLWRRGIRSLAGEVPNWARSGLLSVEERLIQYFADCVCTGYTSLVRTEVNSYRDNLYALFVYVQLQGEYVGGYRALLGEGGRSLRHVDVDSDEKRRSHIFCLSRMVMLLSFFCGNLLFSFRSFFLNIR